MFSIVGANISVNTPDKRDYTILSNIKTSITDRFISFKVKSCKNAYVGLISGSVDTDPLYEIVIGARSNSESCIRIGKDFQADKLFEYFGPVLDCNTHTEFYISWNDDTITFGSGLEVNGPLILTWTSASLLMPISNVGICTIFGATGDWIFYIKGKQSILEMVIYFPFVYDFTGLTLAYFTHKKPRLYLDKYD